jgi:hypothetical protein
VVCGLVEGELHHEGVGVIVSELLSLIDSAITVSMTCEGVVVSNPPEGIYAKKHISKEALVGGIEGDLVGSDQLAGVGDNHEEDVLGFVISYASILSVSVHNTDGIVT